MSNDPFEEAVMHTTARRKSFSKLKMSCPDCGSPQMQLVDWISKPSFWKCRMCSFGFSFEPTVRDAPLGKCFECEKPLSVWCPACNSDAKAYDALKALVTKINELTPDINGMFQIAAIHGALWPKDKNWVAEMKAARAVLETKP